MNSLQPIETQRYMAYDGLIQWTQASIDQASAITIATETMRSEIASFSQTSPEARRMAILDTHTAAHFFIIAVNKLLEYRHWASELGVFNEVDFTEVDAFSRRDIADLRNMREHVVSYYRGEGHAEKRWWVETSDYKSDASGRTGNILGGRLDYLDFAAAAAALLPNLLAETPPQPNL